MNPTDDASKNSQRADPDGVDSPIAQGMALGVLGIEGGLLWRHRRTVRQGADSVSPLSFRGTVHVLAWIAGLVLIAVLGRTVLPVVGAGWYAISLAAMVLVAVAWERHGDGDPTSSDI